MKLEGLGINISHEKIKEIRLRITVLTFIHLSKK